MDSLFESLNSHSAPRRFAVESDDENSEDDFERKTELEETKQPSVSVDGHDLACTVLYVVIGDAGEHWTAGTGKGEQVGLVIVDQEQAASITRHKDVIVVQADSSLHLTALYPFAEAVLKQTKASSLQIIDSYSVDNYLSSSSSTSNPPIRYLQTASFKAAPSSLFKFDIPNLHTGLSSAFLIEADRLSLPARLILLPSAASTIGLGKSRPADLYDPVPNASDDSMRSALQHVDASSLCWSDLDWRYQEKKVKHWSWLQKVRKAREQRKKADAGIDNMYM